MSSFIGENKVYVIFERSFNLNNYHLLDDHEFNRHVQHLIITMATDNDFFVITLYLI